MVAARYLPEGTPVSRHRSAAVACIRFPDRVRSRFALPKALRALACDPPRTAAKPSMMRTLSFFVARASFAVDCFAVSCADNDNRPWPIHHGPGSTGNRARISRRFSKWGTHSTSRALRVSPDEILTPRRKRPTIQIASRLVAINER